MPYSGPLDNADTTQPTEQSEDCLEDIPTQRAKLPEDRLEDIPTLSIELSADHTAAQVQTEIVKEEPTEIFEDQATTLSTLAALPAVGDVVELDLTLEDEPTVTPGQVAPLESNTTAATEPNPRHLTIWPWQGLYQGTAKQRGLSLVLLILLLFGVIAPIVVTASYGISAYATYSDLKAHANSGLQHLLAVKAIFTSANAKSTSMLDINKLELARKELVTAHDEFVQTRSLLDHTSAIQTIVEYLPQYRPQVATARAASQIGIDLTTIGQQIITLARVLAPKLHGPLLSDSHMPLVTDADLSLISTTIDAILPSIDHIQSQARLLSLDLLPIDAHQRTQIEQYIQMLPQIKNVIAQGRSFLSAAGWLLGVDQPRVFLVQTMDRAELRATGGFTGQYGELEISAGRVAPFSLHDISFVEYTNNSPTFGHLAPSAYRSWWPFANWGLRDSNLSADFPTSAQLAIQQYKDEVGHNVDGVLLFTPLLIEHVLQALGPIQIPLYNETITADNLEARFHYYQLDNQGIRKEEIIEHVADPAQARKLFASAVARTLMDRVRHASPDELLTLGRQMLQDLKTRDLQVYFNNPQIEGLLQQNNDAGQIDRSTTHDGLYIVQTNVSANKASVYVQTIAHDVVSLDAKGGATHTMQLSLIYHQLGPVYGLDTYRDYVRIYVPESAKFLGGNGFDTGEPLCGGPLIACPANGVYPHDELICPPGGYDAGAAAPMLNDPYQGGWHPIDKIGPPTNVVSDEPGRAMFGGYIVIPKNCTMTATLSWYVPAANSLPYSLMVQRQAGTFPELDLSILPTPGDCSTLAISGLHFDDILTQDSSFTPNRLTTTPGTPTNCYPQPGI